jgi:hypothetical protein
MQSWLYFGLIEEVADQPVDHKKFLHHDVDNEDEAPCIDVRINIVLNTILKNRRDVDDKLEPTLQPDRDSHINMCLHYALLMCNAFEKVSASHDS